MNTIDVEPLKDALVLKGVLTFDTSLEALKQTQKYLPKEGAIIIDLGGVTRSDSSALAFLTELMRRAKRKKCAFSVRNIPKKMMDLARVSGLDSIIPIK